MSKRIITSVFNTSYTSATGYSLYASDDEGISWSQVYTETSNCKKIKVLKCGLNSWIAYRYDDVLDKTFVIKSDSNGDNGSWSSFLTNDTFTPMEYFGNNQVGVISADSNSTYFLKYGNNGSTFISSILIDTISTRPIEFKATNKQYEFVAACENKTMLPYGYKNNWGSDFYLTRDNGSSWKRLETAYNDERRLYDFFATFNLKSFDAVTINSKLYIAAVGMPIIQGVQDVANMIYLFNEGIFLDQVAGNRYRGYEYNNLSNGCSGTSIIYTKVNENSVDKQYYYAKTFNYFFKYNPSTSTWARTTDSQIVSISGNGGLTFSDDGNIDTTSGTTQYYNKAFLGKSYFNTLQPISGISALNTWNYAISDFYTVSAFVDKTLNFVGKNLSFSAVTDLTGNKIFKYNLGDSIVDYNTTALNYSFTKSYNTFGIYQNLNVKLIQNNIEYASSQNFNITINPLPNINVSGDLKVNNGINFLDINAGSYLNGTILSAVWNFGDGYTSSTTNLTSYLNHTYISNGNYTVSVSAFDISGNIGINSKNISMIQSESIPTVPVTPDTPPFPVPIPTDGGNNDAEKVDYIQICGQDILGRFGKCRNIDLINYLPDYLRGGETETFLTLFEDFLNNMFVGNCGLQVSSTNLEVTKDWISPSATSAIASQDFSYNQDVLNKTKTEATDVNLITLNPPDNINDTSDNQKISILEKVARLTDLHDPDLIDIDYIQFFASNLGYSVDVSRDEICGDNFGISEFTGGCSATDINKYLRFVVQNLPTWYKIKTTKNAIKVMLYSFGLVVDLFEYFTDDYDKNWRYDEGDLNEIQKDWYPTPHFVIKVFHEESTDITADIANKQKVIRAIESIRPINTVFDKLMGAVTRQVELEANAMIRISRHSIIKSNGISNEPGFGGW